MERRAHLRNITPLPSSITRDVALAFLHDHVGMIELNPLVIRHQPTTAPPDASEQEREYCSWYEITDMINYLPGGLAKGEVSYKGGFHDVPDGLQTHVFAPAGVDLRAKWIVGGNMQGEPREPAELGVDKPKEGLYLREETQLKCNIFLMSFVKRNLRKSHDVLVQDLIRKANDGQYQPTSSRRDTRSPTSPNPQSTIINQQTHSTMPIAPATSSQPTPVSQQTSPSHGDAPCSCPSNLHEPMCENFRYTQVHTQSSQTSLKSVHTAREHQPQAAVSPATAARIASGSPTSLNFSRPRHSPSTSITGRSQSVRSDSSASAWRHSMSPSMYFNGVGYVPVELDGQAVKRWEQQREAV